VTTYEVSTYTVSSRTVPDGVRGLAVRLGRALENWGQEAVRPVDHAVVRRELRRQDEVKTRMMADRMLVRHW
jgi:hypothetical protein